MVDNKVTDRNEEMAERVETVMKQTAPGVALERVPLSDGLYCGKETVLYRIMKDMGDRF
jgi:hypothetical protein